MTRILVADNDPDALDLAVLDLRLEGHEVSGAGRRRALELIDIRSRRRGARPPDAARPDGLSVALRCAATVPTCAWSSTATTRMSIWSGRHRRRHPIPAKRESPDAACRSRSLILAELRIPWRQTEYGRARAARGHRLPAAPRGRRSPARHRPCDGARSCCATNAPGAQRRRLRGRAIVATTVPGANRDPQRARCGARRRRRCAVPAGRELATPRISAAAPSRPATPARRSSTTPPGRRRSSCPSTGAATTPTTTRPGARRSSLPRRRRCTLHPMLATCSRHPAGSWCAGRTASSRRSAAAPRRRAHLRRRHGPHRVARLGRAELAARPGIPGTGWLWAWLILAVFAGVSAALGFLHRREAAARAVCAALEHNRALVSGLAPVLQASLDLGEVAPASPRTCRDGLHLAGLSLPRRATAARGRCSPGARHRTTRCARVDAPDRLAPGAHPRARRSPAAGACSACCGSSRASR